MAGSSITETWEYKTDIITSYDGHEQRIKTRVYPRRKISFDYPAMDKLQAQWLRGMARIRQNEAYYIPQWHTPIRLKSDHLGGLALFIEERHMLSLYDCEYIEVFVRDEVNSGSSPNIIAKVHYYSDGVIGLVNPMPKDLLKANTWIFPLKRCSLQPMSGLEYIWANGSNVTLSFEDLLIKPATVQVPGKYVTQYQWYKQMNRWNLPEQIDGRQVFRNSPQWVEDSNLTLSVEKATNRLDNYTGTFVYDLKNWRSYDIHTMELSLMCREAINNMIVFFARVCGRFNSFYAPTWVNDVTVIKDIYIGESFVYVDWDDIAQYYKNNARPKKIVAFTKDWKSYIASILGYSYDMVNGKKVGKILLSQPAQANLSKDLILMTSYINLVRFDSDTLQLNFETDEVANVTLIMREVDDV